MRERIIAEIKRLAEKNDGRAPGRQVFEAETGIRYAEWYGIHWARWGDAVAEAGFAPNMLQAKLDKDAILTMVAEAYRHVGRVATNGELRLYARAHPDFPTHSTFDNHFGGKAGLVAAMRAWTSERPKFADVAAMLPTAGATPPSPRRQKQRDGSVYLIQAGEFYKVGRSDELERRVKEIRTALPHAGELVHAITTDDPSGIEAYWHRRFAEKRANGEWFRLTPADVLAFKRRRFQ
jgi:hypothetical protein